MTGNAGLARPAGRRGGRRGFKSVHVQRPRIHDPLAFQVLGLQQQALIAAAKHRALAAAIDHDQRLRARGLRHCEDARIHSGPRKFAAMQSAASSSPSLPT